MNFWKTLPHPFMVLAPMDAVTDFVFRETVAQNCRPDVFFTEFTGVEGLNNTKAKPRLLPKLKFSEKQHPIVAQIWGLDLASFENAARLVQELGFDGIDLNMGCPDHSVVRRGACAGLIGNHEHVAKIVQAVRNGSSLPLSIKTRLGITTNVADTWIPFLLGLKLDALTIHGRIASQMSKGENNWEEIGKAVDLRNKIAPNTLIIGNGNVTSFAHALQLQRDFGIDGVMIGRGIFHNPWVFQKTTQEVKHTREEYLNLLLNHLDLFDQTWGTKKHFDILKKFFKMYVKDFKGDNDLRLKLMETKNAKEVRDILKLS